MSATTKTEDRVVVPAWYQSFEAGNSPEFRALKANKILTVVGSSLDELYDDFIQVPELGKAIDLLNVAYTQGDMNSAVIAAKYIVSSGKSLPIVLERFARMIMGGLSSTDNHSLDKSNEQLIHDKKRWLKKNPADCISWIDLSRLYMSIGQVDAAERAIRIGMNLSKKNRWVTRVVSRFFYNIDEYDKAHHILLRHPDIKVDPWLLAAELAVASGSDRPTRHWGNAKRALELGYEAYHITELQSSVGTLELKSGAIKKARKLFTESLIWPNGNVLAQAKWAEKKGNMNELVMTHVLDGQSRAFEAKFLDAYGRQDMELALEFGMKWIDEEPFNANPSIQTSYIASLLDRYEDAKQISENGLKINSNDETLQLNLIFSKIALAEMNEKDGEDGLIESALQTIEKMLKSDNKTIVAHAFANMGLIYYRQNELDKGRQSYEQAVNILKSLSHPSAVLAELNHLRESLIAMAPWREELFIKLESLAGSGGFWDEPSVPFYLRKLMKIRQDSSNWRTRLTERVESVHLPTPCENTKSQIDFSFDFGPENPTIWLPNGKK